MKFAVISHVGDGLPFALRLKDEGHQVCFYVPDTPPSYTHREVGRGLVGKAESLPQLLAWGRQDAVYVFDLTHEGKTAEMLRRRGCLVVGGGEFPDRLECDRLFGEKFAEACGMRVPLTKHFSTITETIAYIKAHPIDHYFKMDSDLSISSTAHGEPDVLIPRLEALRKRYKDQLSNILQECKEGIDVSTAAWWNGRDWIGPYEGTAEKKKLMNGEVGPSTGCSGNVVWFYDDYPKIARELCFDAIGEAFRKLNAPPGIYDVNSLISRDDKLPYFLEFTPRCYSLDTEVLTHEGWRPMTDVRIGDIVASLDDEKNLVYVPVQNTIRKSYCGDMISLKSDTVYDLLVTQDHDLVFQREDGTLYAIQADALGGKDRRTVRTAKWKGLDVPTYTIPAHIENHYLGKHDKTMEIKHKERIVPMETWCTFLALWISNGFVHYMKGVPYQVHIAEKTQIVEVEEIIAALGFRYSYHGHKFDISSTQLARHLHSLFGHVRAWQKRLPRFVLDLSPKYLEAFLDGYTLGDGHTHKRTGQRIWTTTSKGMAEDLNEILLRVGRWSRIVNIGPGGYEGSVHDMYVVPERKEKIDGRLFPNRHVSREHYEGEVVCLSVPHHRLYVRRPGGPAMWCGNCGYDADPLAQRALTGELGEFYYNLATGRAASFPVDTSSAQMSVRVCIPPYPLETVHLFPSEKRDRGSGAIGVRVNGVDPTDLSQLYAGNGNQFIGYGLGLEDGNLIVTEPGGIVGIVCADGKDCERMNEDILDFIQDELDVPDLMYRTDMGEALSEHVGEIRALGYETGPVC